MPKHLKTQDIFKAKLVMFSSDFNKISQRGLTMSKQSQNRTFEKHNCQCFIRNQQDFQKWANDIKTIN